MTERRKLVFQAILLILKNATIIIPLIEGVIDSISSINHSKKHKGETNASEKQTDAEFKECE